MGHVFYVISDADSNIVDIDGRVTTKAVFSTKGLAQQCLKNSGLDGLSVMPVRIVSVAENEND